MTLNNRREMKKYCWGDSNHGRAIFIRRLAYYALSGEPTGEPGRGRGSKISRAFEAVTLALASHTRSRYFAKGIRRK